MSASGRTNQCLHFARLSLSEGEQAADQGNLQIQRRHEEAALFHTYAGFMGFCAEVASQYGLAPIRDLAELLSREGLPAEVVELRLLMDDSTTWLSNLVATHQRALIQGLDDNRANSSLITSQSDYLALIRNWLIELENLVNRHREHYLEC